MIAKGLKLVINETVNYIFTAASLLRRFSVCDKLALAINEKGKKILTKYLHTNKQFSKWCRHWNYFFFLFV